MLLIAPDGRRVRLPKPLEEHRTVVLTGTPSLAGAQRRGDALKAELAERFGIPHVTLELECDDPTQRTEPSP